MKKLLLIFLCGIVSLALIGCAGDETKSEKEAKSHSKTQSEAPEKEAPSHSETHKACSVCCGGKAESCSGY